MINSAKKNRDAVKKSYYHMMLLISCLVAVSGGTVCGQSLAEAPPADATKHILAAGDEAGVYLLLARRYEDEEGFQIFFRGKGAQRFARGRQYHGQCDDVTVWKGRLLAFLSTGGCQSYDLMGSRTERNLPRGLRCVASASEAGRVYVLGRAGGAIEIPFAPREEQAAAEVVDANAPGSSQSLCAVGSGEYVLVARSDGDEWHSLTDAPFSLDGWRQFSLAAAEGRVHLFGIVAEGMTETSRGRVLHRELQDRVLGEAELVPVENAASMVALSVGKAVQLIVGVEPEGALPGVSSESVFLSGGQEEGNWDFAELKLRGLGGDGPQKVEFAAFGEEIAVFQWGSDEEVLFGCYGPADEELKCQLANMAAVGAQEGSALLYLHAVWLFCVVAGLLVGVLWWRRAEAFIEQIPLPDAVRVAPLWRRGLAFLIDSVPTMLITVALMPGLGKELAEQGATLQQIQSEYVLLMSLRLTVVWLPVLILYYSIGEGLRGMTPGKMALGLVVISYDARGLTVGQALLRNIMRLLELFPQMFPFVILLTLFTRRVQRPGDLLARTIVVLDTPELRNHLRDAARGES